MELCAIQSIPNLPKIAATSYTLPRPSSSLIPLFGHRRCLLSLHSRRIVPRAITPDDTSGGASPCATTEERAVAVEVRPVIENSTYSGSTTVEPAKEESPVDEQVNDFLAGLKFESEDIYSILLYGGGALVALWLASIVVGAIDSIPLFPKLMEVVGLGYTFWFTSRYLLFKKNRDELGAKLEELKQQVLGSSDD